MTLTDIIIILIVCFVIYFILHYEIKNSRSCHCSQIKRLSRLKKMYKKIK